MYLQEVHCLALADLYEKYNGFKDNSIVEIISLFNIFTNISIANDEKLEYPTSNDKNIQLLLKDITNNLNKYYDLECENQIDTGANYEVQYEITDYIKEWCQCNSELECKNLINKIKLEKNIFLGEFVKALLKINNIAIEFEKICETLQNINLLQKIKQIPKLTLKYIASNQSLYI